MREIEEKFETFQPTVALRQCLLSKRTVLVGLGVTAGYILGAPIIFPSTLAAGYAIQCYRFFRSAKKKSKIKKSLKRQ